MQPERDKKAIISEALFGRLSSRGLTPIEIPRLVKDVYNIIGNGGHFTVTSVNQGLRRLGWSERTMDTISFELIVFLLENEGDYQVERHMIH